MYDILCNMDTLDNNYMVYEKDMEIDSVNPL